MNTQAERLTSRREARVFGFAYLTQLAAWIELKREARRARRHEMELREMLKAMSPKLLNDIGISLDANGDPMLALPKQNAHVVVAKILNRPRRHCDPY